MTPAKLKKYCEDLEHANQVQATTIGELRVRAEMAVMALSRAMIERDIARAKHSGLLKEFRAFKDLIRHLGSVGTEIEWQDGEGEKTSTPTPLKLSETVRPSMSLETLNSRRSSAVWSSSRSPFSKGFCARM